MSARPRVGRLAIVLVFAAQAAFAPSARADEDDVAALLRRGFELRREHRNEEALAAYDRAFALSPTPAVRAQRALAEQALGHWLVAERELDVALAADDPWIARNRASLEAARTFVGQHLAWLEVDVDAPEADIRLDGQPFPQATAVRVEAGAAVLDVRAPGRVADVRHLLLAATEHVHEQIALAPLAVTSPASADPAPSVAPEALQPAPQADPAPRTRSGIPPVSIALGAAGLVGIATGAYFGVRSGQQLGDERAHCVGGCTEAASRDYADAKTSATVSTIAFGAGAACIAGGVVLWLLDRRAPSNPPRAVHVGPALGGGMKGLVVRGLF